MSIYKGSLMEHPQLESGGRKRFKIYRIQPKEDLDVTTIEDILREAIALYNA